MAKCSLNIVQAQGMLVNFVVQSVEKQVARSGVQIENLVELISN